MDFKERLFELRRQAGLSQEELAHLLGLTRQAVQKWEAGTSRPDMDNLAALADYFHVSLDYLTGREGACPPPPPEREYAPPAVPSPPATITKSPSSKIFASCSAFSSTPVACTSYFPTSQPRNFRAGSKTSRSIIPAREERGLQTTINFFNIANSKYCHQKQESTNATPSTKPPKLPDRSPHPTSASLP